MVKNKPALQAARPVQGARRVGGARPSQAASLSRGASPILTTLCTVALTVIGAAIATRAEAQSGPLEDLAQFPRTSVEILHGKSKKDPRHFDVWIANNSGRQEQGLMFVRELQPGQGMLFPLAKPRKMNMWMKDVFVELDIVFVGEKGAIDKIIEHAKPLDLTTLISDKPVTLVLEIKGGEAANQGLKVGDRVNWVPPEGCDCGPAPPPKPPKESH
jgi:flagellin-like protein